MEAESANSYTVEVTAATLHVGGPRAAFVTHQSQECMGALTDTTFVHVSVCLPW